MKKSFQDFREELKEGTILVVPRFRWSANDLAAIKTDSRKLAVRVTLRLQDLVGDVFSSNTRLLMKNGNIRPGDAGKILEAWFELDQWKGPVIRTIEKQLHARVSNSASGPEFMKKRPSGEKIHPPNRGESEKSSQIFPFARRK